MRRFLIVANQTLGGSHLRRKIAECMAEGPCRFHVVVPATRDPNHRMLWTEGQSNALARRRLEAALQNLRAMGADVDGQVGDPSALAAISDVLRDRDFDEIILSTLPSGASRWLLQDLPRRVRACFPGPVAVIVASREDLARIDLVAEERAPEVAAPAPARSVESILMSPNDPDGLEAGPAFG